MSNAKNKGAAPAAAATGTTVEKVDGETGEITTRYALPAVTATHATAVLPSGITIKHKKTVSHLLLKHGDGERVAVTILSPVYTGKEIKGSKMAAADMVKVRDLVTGGEKEYILNTVTKGHLEDNYKNNSYVGKSFLITKDYKTEGKRWVNVSLDEIEVA